MQTAPRFVWQSFHFRSGSCLRFCGVVFIALAWLACFASAQTITNQPQSVVTTNGGSATFSVGVSGTGPFGYQWSFNGTNLPASIINTYAGNGTGGYSGDGGPATNAEVNTPSGMAMDASGNLFFADCFNQRVRKVSANGIISTVAGNGTRGFSGDGGPATNASLNYPVLGVGGAPPAGVAVDAVGNLYIVDPVNELVRKVDTNGIIHTVAGGGTNGLGDGGAAVAASLSDPTGVAVDASGNLFIVDTGNGRIRKVNTHGIITTVVGNGSGGYTGDGGAATNATMNDPQNIAVDAFGNLFIADGYNSAIRKVTTNGIISTVAGNGVKGFSGDGGLATNATLSDVFAVVPDAAGNFYISDTEFNERIRKVDTYGYISTVAGNGTEGYSGDGGPATSAAFFHPYGIALDAFGNPLIADAANRRVRKVTFIGAAPTLVLNNVTLNQAGNYQVIVTNPHGSITSSVAVLTVLSQPVYSLGTNALGEGANAGGDSVILTVIPQGAAWTNTANAAWLHLSPANQNGMGSTNVVFSFDANPGATRIGTLTIAGQTLTVTQIGPTFTLGATARLEGPAAGSDSVVLAVNPNFGAWTATTNAGWLHLTPPNQSGIGSTNVIFSFDANSGATRVGTISIAGQTLTVTQAGSTYVAAGALTILVNSGLSFPCGVAVDRTGNVYIADTFDEAIKEWSVTGNTVTTLLSSGLAQPFGVTLDAAGNVYIANTDDGTILKFSPALKNPATLVSGLSDIFGVAVDGAGNVYIPDTFDNAILKWVAASNSVTTLLSSGLNNPEGAAVDVAGNVYIADTGNSAIKELSAANNTVSTLVSAGLTYVHGVAVDGAGNVYIADGDSGAIKEWSAASNTVTTLLSAGLGEPVGLAVDGARNVYISDYVYNTIEELPYVFVDPTARLESANAGNDALPGVLPATANLRAPFAPASDQPWLTITGAANGVVSFSFTANLGSSRTAHITLLGQTIPVTQGGPAFVLGTAARLEGPTASNDSVVLAVNPNFGAWTATSNAAWLHLSPANQIGTGSTNVVFSFDANPGATRIGILTIGGQTLTVTQAGSTYVAASPLTTLVSGGLHYPNGMVVSSAGNVYVADTVNGAVKEWTATNNSVAALVSSGLYNPADVAVDAAGNVYIADTWNFLIKKWTVASGNVTTLVSSGLDYPYGIALDGASNLFIADTYHNAIKKWTATNNTVTTVVSSGLNHPFALALDIAGNVYIADTANNAVKEWIAANNTVITLVSSGLGESFGITVDGAGNVYIDDTDNWELKEWSAVNNTVSVLVPSLVSSPTGLQSPYGVAVDATGNIYISDSGNEEVRELPYAFVDPTPKYEGVTAGSDALPTVLPATENLLAPFAPTSSQSWLTITDTANGVVSFSFTANTGPSRSALITLLGQAIPVTQQGLGGRVNLPSIITGAQMLDNGAFQLAISAASGGSFTVLSTTNLALPMSDWTVIGAGTNSGNGQFQFTSQPMTNDRQRFFRTRSP